MSQKSAIQKSVDCGGDGGGVVGCIHYVEVFYVVSDNVIEGKVVVFGRYTKALE